MQVEIQTEMEEKQAVQGETERVNIYIFPSKPNLKAGEGQINSFQFTFNLLWTNTCGPLSAAGIIAHTHTNSHIQGYKYTLGV